VAAAAEGVAKAAGGDGRASPGRREDSLGEVVASEAVHLACSGLLGFGAEAELDGLGRVLLRVYATRRTVVATSSIRWPGGALDQPTLRQLTHHVAIRADRHQHSRRAPNRPISAEYRKLIRPSTASSTRVHAILTARALAASTTATLSSPVC